MGFGKGCDGFRVSGLIGLLGLGFLRGILRVSLRVLSVVWRFLWVFAGVQGSIRALRLPRGSTMDFVKTSIRI